MFIKYFLKNLKKHGLQYILVVLLETALLCVALTASGIALNMLSDDFDGTNEEARHYGFIFGEPLSYDDEQNTIYELLDALPVPFEEVMVTAKGYYCNPLFWYHDYETMCRVLKKRFGLQKGDLPTEQQYANGEKVAVVGMNAGEMYINGEYVQAEYNFTDDNHILLDGEEYLVSGRYSGYGVYVFLNAAPNGYKLSGIDMQLMNVPTTAELNNIYELTEQYFGGAEIIYTPKIDDLLDKRSDDANVLLSVVALSMSVFNTLLVFRYMLSSRRKYFAVLRFAGFSKATSVVYSGAELLLMSLVSELLSFVIFSKLIMPIMGRYYSVFSKAVFTFDYYLALYGVYLGIIAVMFAVYIVPSLTSSVAAELREI